MTRNTHPRGIDVISMSEQYETHSDIPNWKVKRIAIEISHSDIDSKILLEE